MWLLKRYTHHCCQILSIVKAQQVGPSRLKVTLVHCHAGQAGFVANMSEIAPANAGQMFGLCNTFGSLAGILGTASVGFIVEKTGSFNVVFQLTAALYVAATVFWNIFCTSEPQFPALQPT